jgi:hypothetical protein
MAAVAYEIEAFGRDGAAEPLEHQIDRRTPRRRHPAQHDPGLPGRGERLDHARPRHQPLAQDCGAEIGDLARMHRLGIHHRATTLGLCHNAFRPARILEQRTVAFRVPMPVQTGLPEGEIEGFTLQVRGFGQNADGADEKGAAGLC